MVVKLFSDGSSRGNPGPGGYGTILQYTDPKGKFYEREYSCGYENTTNNRMELMGVITGLEALKKGVRVEVYTDSKYVSDAFNKNWIQGWLRSDFRRNTKNPVKNVDLWKRLLKASEGKEVNYNWIKGHAGHPENERCDSMAVSAALSDNLDKDEWE